MSLPSLSYDTPRHPTPTIWLHYVALLCGVIPLGAGTLVFIVFLIARMELYMVLGALTILTGVCMAFVGIVCASVYLYQARRAAPDEAVRARRRAFIDLGVIILNFPIAFGMTWFGLWLMSRVTITVHNADAVPIQQLQLIRADGDAHGFGTIVPGTTKSTKVPEDDLEELVFTFTRNGVEHRQTVSDVWIDEFGGAGERIYLSVRNGKLTQD